ncbi:ADP-ribose pyrophosphatase YjhB, NUDIX family [Microbispora rosea]|uniref:ADP-ribose pyrophosphatase YjhB, NUDIX family n=1 Tax=Microbispora rosea TaxID=58117 RepID=A0A1N7CNC0_9ACTN|nr:NUDIX hydrolase [Microbispora rosea]GIH46397.1 ADP-ribose pyrophosphatase [Microbispora rosea subsp. rosea]SIR65126.1 ADP-ribose pyrophosphatase YjhB, NUDIX family [Microbispora rosea]
MIPADVFYAGLFKVAAAAAGFLTDSSGRVLLVKPGYRDHWGWPGGHIDEGESPEAACGRELAEELGLTRQVGRLLVVQWVPPLDDRPIPLVHFLFDCGTFEDGTGEDGTMVVLQEEELDDYGFFTAEQAASLMPAYLVARLTAAQRARATGETVYLPVSVAE